MANYFYGANQGQGEFDAVVGTSTNSTDVELFVNGTTTGIGKEQVELAIEFIRGFLLQNAWPLAASGNYYIGVNVGQVLKDVVGAASTNSTDFELRINTTNVTVRNEVIVLLDVFTNHVLRNGFPPV